jgi:hypothetical protein
MPNEQLYIADFHVCLSTIRLPTTPIPCKIYYCIGRIHPHASRSTSAAHGKYMHRTILVNHVPECTDIKTPLNASIQSIGPQR